MDLISCPHLTFGGHNAEDALTRHHTIAGGLVDRTIMVAGLPDLRDLQNHGRAYAQAAADRQLDQLDPASQYVFGKITGTNLNPFATHPLG
jgi:hypothetical protein